MAVLELVDEQSGKVKYVGFEEDAMDFTKANPSCTYIINDITNDKRKMYKFKQELAAKINSNS